MQGTNDLAPARQLPDDEGHAGFRAEWLSYDDLSAWLGIPKATLYSKVCRREIPHHRLGRRLVRFRRTDIERWLTAHEVGPARRGDERVFLDVAHGRRGQAK